MKTNEYMEQTCLLYTSGSWKYRKEDGTMAASEWITHLNRRYYLNADEIMCTGLSMVNGKLYYFESWGGAGFQGWKKVGGAWYYLNEDGSVKTNEWFVHDKRTYHVDEKDVYKRQVPFWEEKEKISDIIRIAGMKENGFNSAITIRFIKYLQ